jgi:hypothetical protein
MTCSQFFLIARLSDAFTSSRARNRCPFDCPSLQENKLDPELSAIQWLVEQRLLSIHEAADEWAIQLLELEEEQKAYERETMRYQYQF